MGNLRHDIAIHGEDSVLPLTTASGAQENAQNLFFDGVKHPSLIDA